MPTAFQPLDTKSAHTRKKTLRIRKNQRNRNLSETDIIQHKKWSFPLRISLVNVNKLAEQIFSFLLNCPHLLQKFRTEHFIFRSVSKVSSTIQFCLHSLLCSKYFVQNSSLFITITKRTLKQEKNKLWFSSTILARRYVYRKLKSCSLKRFRKIFCTNLCFEFH